MYRCPICNSFLEMVDGVDGAVCNICGITFGWAQLQKIVADDKAWTGQKFYVHRGVLLHYAGNDLDMVIPDGIVVIDDLTFRDCKFTSVVIPDSVKEIHKYAFKNCTQLKKVYVGKGLQRSDIDAFVGCTAIDEVHINDLSAWCKAKLGLQCTSTPFVNCGRLFVQGKEVKDLVLPENSKIESYHFAGCSSIVTVTVPKTAKIEGYAFDGCRNLKTIRFEGTPCAKYYLPKNCEIIVPETVKVVREKEREEQAKKASEIFTSAYSNLMKIIEERKAKGVCAHCGGKFTLITKTCKFCGKKKDY